MKWAGRIVVGVAGLLLVAALALFLLRKPLAAFAVERALAGAGADNPAASVTAFGLSGATLTVSAGRGEDALGATVEAGWSLGGLFRDGAVQSLILRDAAATLILDDEGTWSIRGLTLVPSDGPAGTDAPVLPDITIENAALAIRTPAGDGRAALSGEVTRAAGGAFSVTAQSARLGTDAATLVDGELSGDVRFRPDGTASLSGRLTGDVQTQGSTLRQAELLIDAALAAWPSVLDGDYAPVTAEASIRIKSARAPDDPAAPGDDEWLSADGALSVDIDGAAESAVVSIVSPLTLAHGSGARLIVTTEEERPFVRLGRDTLAAAARLALDSEMARGELAVSARGVGDAPYEVTASGTLARLSVGPVTAADIGIDGEGTVSAEGGQATVAPRATELSVGDLSFDGLSAGALVVQFDRASSVATLSAPEGAPPAVATRITAPNGVSARNVSLSPADTGAPLLRFRLDTEEPSGDAAAVLAAGSLSITQGDTRIVLREARVPATVTMAGGETRAAFGARAVRAELGGPAVFTDLSASGTALLSGEGVEVDLPRLGVTLTSADREAPLFAPVVAGGRAAWAAEALTADLALDTPRGIRLGTLVATHDGPTAVGQATLSMQDLFFTPAGLQPERLVPALRGIIGETTGALDGTAQFNWSKEGFTSSAILDIDELTFQGPGVAVAETRGVDGTLTLESLVPLKTDGPQTLRLAAIDLKATELTDGTVRFSLPGDNALVIDEASFPWFGGRLFTEGARGALDGRIDIPLSVENIDLGALLDYLDVDGLSGEGTLEGTLPLVADNFALEIVDGRLRSVGPGVIRYTGLDQVAATASNEAQIAFDALRDLRFESLSATVNGPLDGEIDFGLRFVGRSSLDLSGGEGERVDAPVIYNLTIEAPVLSLLEQARLSFDARAQIERARQEQEARRRAAEEAEAEREP